MRLANKKHAEKIYVDGEVFEDVDIMSLHGDYGFYFDIWLYARKLDMLKGYENEGFLIEHFLIFEEALQEFIEQWQTKKFQY